MTDHAHMARVYMTEARTRHGNPSQREFVTWLVSKARDRHHRHIRAGKTGQQEMKL